MIFLKIKKDKSQSYEFVLFGGANRSEVELFLGGFD